MLIKCTLHISKTGTKVSIGGFKARVKAVYFIPFLGFNTVKNAMKSQINQLFELAFCYFVIPYAILQYFI